MAPEPRRSSKEASGTAELFSLRERVCLERLAIDGADGKRGEINDAVVLLGGGDLPLRKLEQKTIGR